jgi:hypothetical protein
MPLITIWNWQSTEKDKLPELREALSRAVMDIEVLGLRDEIDEFDYDLFTICYGGQAWSDHRKAHLTILVEILFEKPERTEAVRLQLAEALGRAAKSVIGQHRRVEVAVKRFNQDRDGFWAG